MQWAHSNLHVCYQTTPCAGHSTERSVSMKEFVVIGWSPGGQFGETDTAYHRALCASAEEAAQALLQEYEVTDLHGWSVQCQSPAMSLFSDGYYRVMVLEVARLSYCQAAPYTWEGATHIAKN